MRPIQVVASAERAPRSIHRSLAQNLEIRQFDIRQLKNVKTIGLVVAAVLLAVIVLQNTEPANTRILFFTVTMPRAVLLFLLLILGFVLGLVARWKLGPTEAAEAEKR